MKTEKYSETDASDLYLDVRLTSSLYDAAKWGKILAVLGFILSGLILVFGLFMQPYVQMPGAVAEEADIGLSGFTTLLYSFVALVYFFPSLYLYGFSSHLQKGIKEHNREQIRKAIRKLKIMFKFMSIMLLLFLVLFGFSLLMLATEMTGLEM